MIDVIIPAYNAHDTIINTLNSILLQDISKILNVYIVDDGSDKNYNNIVNKFSKFLNIVELGLEKNSGPGFARQYGIDNSKSDYIIFIDADDIFYNNYSIKYMYECIKKNNLDIAIFDFIEECKDIRIKHSNDDIWMHGKIYKRKFLLDNKIKFNDTRQNEDSGFNRLCMLCNPHVLFKNDVVYVWKYNENSITRKNKYKYSFYGIEGYAKNMVWVIKNAELKNCDKRKISKLIFKCLLEIYYYYLKYYDLKQSNLILGWCRDLNIYFKKYEKILSEFDKKEIIYKQTIKIINDYTMLNYIISDISFNEFLERISDV